MVIDLLRYKAKRFNIPLSITHPIFGIGNLKDVAVKRTDEEYRYAEYAYYFPETEETMVCNPSSLVWANISLTGEILQREIKGTLTDNEE